MAKLNYGNNFSMHRRVAIIGDRLYKGLPFGLFCPDLALKKSWQPWMKTFAQIDGKAVG
jgi:hypothetical protein